MEHRISTNAFHWILSINIILIAVRDTAFAIYSFLIRLLHAFAGLPVLLEPWELFRMLVSLNHSQACLFGHYSSLARIATLLLIPLALSILILCMSDRTYQKKIAEGMLLKEMVFLFCFIECIYDKFPKLLIQKSALIIILWTGSRRPTYAVWFCFFYLGTGPHSGSMNINKFLQVSAQ